MIPLKNERDFRFASVILRQKIAFVKNYFYKSLFFKIYLFLSCYDFRSWHELSKSLNH